MPWFSADLHLHSCLSPCGSLDSSPKRIAQTAKERGLDLVALTDHNSSLNCPSFEKACKDHGLNTLFGMEATTAEEAHCLCLFENLETAMFFSESHYKTLVPIPNQVERWGDQVWVNDDEEIEGEVEILLLSASHLNLEELGQKTHSLGGLFIPAHVDRASFSLMSQLGFVPPGDYDALEIFRPTTTYSTLRYKPKQLESLERENDLDSFLAPRFSPALLCNSDAHFLEDIACRHFEFWAKKPDFQGLKIALQNSWIKIKTLNHPR